ncbi:MAG: hypothetical protein H5U37_03830 [Caldisericia bacterium]|nr:hypothetical protein [Caldisericia bacterium]
MQNLITGFILIGLTIFFYIFLFFKNDNKKLKRSVKKGIKQFIKNSIRLFAVFLIIGLLQSFLSKEAVANFLLKFQGFKGIIFGELTGAIMMGPVASGYPIGKYLVENGASISLISAFLLSWVLIGIVSISIEFKEFEVKFAISRNVLTLIFIILISILMEILI